MHSHELELLKREYENANTREGKLIKRKLEAIALLCKDCRNDEFYFANEITVEFCRVISLLKEMHEKEKKAVIDEYEELYSIPDKKHIGYVTEEREMNGNNRSDDDFKDGDSLLIAFYNRFRNEQKKKNEQEKVNYPSITELDDLKKNIKINSTMKDYVARIKTFSNSYLYELPRIESMRIACDKLDDILFVYKNIELILADFNTRNENGTINKQKSNIQSALRKLNELKRGRISR